MKTYSTKAKDIQRHWHVIDASGKTLGKIATEAATLLMGKHKPMYVRYMDTGDYVIVLNAEKVKVTGKKLNDKKYYRYTGYPSGLKQETLGEMLAKHPTRVIQHAVKGMLPHTTLGKAMLKKLKVYAGDSHPHQAQIVPAKANEGGKDSQ
jgi:large subunit ribosomal protein L13